MRVRTNGGGEMEELNRRDFAGMLAALLGTAALATQAEGRLPLRRVAGQL